MTCHHITICQGTDFICHETVTMLTRPTTIISPRHVLPGPNKSPWCSCLRATIVIWGCPQLPATAICGSTHLRFVLGMRGFGVYNYQSKKGAAEY